MVTKICIKCNNEFLINQKINNKWYRFYKRKYCLNCSPLYSYMSKKLDSLNKTQGEHKICKTCGQIKPINDFSNNNKDGYKTSSCKNCSAEKIRTSRQRFKQECVNYLGGKCIICGYNKCLDALEFHHINPKEKDFGIARYVKNTLDSFVKKELDKCELRCSNCHREKHHEIYINRLL